MTWHGRERRGGGGGGEIFTSGIEDRKLRHGVLGKEWREGREVKGEGRVATELEAARTKDGMSE